MITFRRLQLKDAKKMLEWMHDPSISYKYKTDFDDYTIQDAEDFIVHSFSEDNQHFAVVNVQDEYLGTISLKNISKYNNNAELTSAFRSCADKDTYAGAVLGMIQYGFEKLQLDEIYVRIFEDHGSLIDYYESLGFLKGGTFVNQLHIREQSKKLCWYYKRRSANYEGVHQMMHFQEQGDRRGHMVVIEQFKDVPFQIRRIFYIYGSDSNTKRGLHANRKSEFVLVNVAGSSKIKVFDGKSEYIYELVQPHTGVYLPKMVWKEMYDFSEDSVLLVLSNEIYDPLEYIRDFEEYKRCIGTVNFVEHKSNT